MRRRLTWLLLLTTLLTGCLPGRQAEPPAEGALLAGAEMEGTGIRFTLEGYAGTELPRLEVASIEGTDWSEWVEPPQREGDAITAKLRGERGTARLMVEEFTFAWLLPDGQRVEGEIQFRDYRFRQLRWQTTPTPKLLIYHTRPLRAGDTATWERAIEQVSEWTGQEREGALAIWLFPDSRTLNEWARTSADHEVAGQWWYDIQRLIIFDEQNVTERLVVMYHEMVHAVSPGHGPPWFEEGIATLIEARVARMLEGDKALRWRARRPLLAELHEIALQRPVDPFEGQPNREPPLDAYTVGLSIWLFVKHHFGEEGVKRFFAEGGQENGVKHTLEAMFDKPLPEVWADWNAYLRSPDLLKDWEEP